MNYDMSKFSILRIQSFPPDWDSEDVVLISGPDFYSL